MRRYVTMLAIAGLLLCGALIAGCASTNYGTGTTAPTSSTTAVQTTAGGAAGQATTTVVPMTTTAPTTVPPTTATITTAITSAGGAASVDLTAQNIKFDKSSITVPAGAQVTVHFNNKDSGVPHTFSVYTDSSASTVIFKGQQITGPGTTTYTFMAPSTPGTYFFRCDVHPAQMTGQFIVQ